MSIYWKQSLWLGGVYWVLSLVFRFFDSFELMLCDVLLMILLTIFLIPMNFIKPVKWIEKVMRKTPVSSTFFVAVGWVPYFIVAIGLLTMISSLVIMIVSPIDVEYLLFQIAMMTNVVEIVCLMLIVLAVLGAIVSVFVYHKSVEGCLNRKYRLDDGVECDKVVINEAAKNSAKEMYECKQKSLKKEDKKTVAKKQVAQKTVKKTKVENKKNKKTTSARKVSAQNSK